MLSSSGRCRRFLAALALSLAFASAHAQVAGDPAAVVEPLLAQGMVHEGEGWLVDSRGFRVRVYERGGLAYRVEGSGVLAERDIELVAEMVAAGTGLGAGIVQPVKTFFAERSEGLAGQGRVAVAVDRFALSIEIGNDDPASLDVSLALQQVDESAFPEGRHARGPDDAVYVIREFSDFQCPYCASFATDALPRLEAELLGRDDVRFEYHHFPLQSIHANAAAAAEAAECVAASNEDADAFWSYHDALFEAQRAWSGLGDPGPYFARLAADLGLGGDAVEACIDERAYADLVQDAYRTAAGPLRLQSTPTLFVNGFRVERFLEADAYVELFDLVDAFARDERVYVPGGGSVDGE